jgi:hypothetical protein
VAERRLGCLVRGRRCDVTLNGARLDFGTRLSRMCGSEPAAPDPAGREPKRHPGVVDRLGRRPRGGHAKGRPTPWAPLVKLAGG